VSCLAAIATNEAAERTKEQALQNSINKVVQDGQQIIDRAVADAAAARHDLSVRDEADNAAHRFATVKAAAIPALPPQARQLPAQSWCLPTCSAS